MQKQTIKIKFINEDIIVKDLDSLGYQNRIDKFDWQKDELIGEKYKNLLAKNYSSIIEKIEKMFNEDQNTSLAFKNQILYCLD